MPDIAVTKTMEAGTNRNDGEQRGQSSQEPAGDTKGEASGKTSALRPLRRMRQLALEVQAAVARGEMDIMSKAAALLAPSLAQWAESRADVAPNDPTMLRLTRETQQALADCEQAVLLAMLPIEARSNETRQHQSRLKQMRVRRQAQTKNLRPSRLLDARR